MMRTRTIATGAGITGSADSGLSAGLSTTSSLVRWAFGREMVRNIEMQDLTRSSFLRRKNAAPKTDNRFP